MLGLAVSLAACAPAALAPAATPASPASAASASSPASPSVAPTPRPAATPTASLSPATGTLSGDGWIAWQADAGLTVARLDGSERTRPFANGAGHPDWSPDGSRLAYRIDQQDGTTDLFTVNRDGSDVRVLVECAAPCEIAEEPAWSPDGTRIAYWTNGDDQPQVIRVADAGTGKTLLTVPAPDLVGPITPRWSPDGRYLVVHCEIVEAQGDGYATVDGRIGLIDLEAKRPTITFLTDPGLKAMYPDWSPDGTRILFLAGNVDPFFGSPDPTDLYTIRPDGTDLVRLTHRAPGEPKLGGPTWTRADPPILGTLIKGGGRFTLAALEADGTGLIELVGADGAPFSGAHPRVWVAP